MGKRNELSRIYITKKIDIISFGLIYHKIPSFLLSCPNQLRFTTVCLYSFSTHMAWLSTSVKAKVFLVRGLSHTQITQQPGTEKIRKFLPILFIMTHDLLQYINKNCRHSLKNYLEWVFWYSRLTIWDNQLLVIHEYHWSYNSKGHSLWIILTITDI